MAGVDYTQEIHVANGALLRLGAEPIGSLTEKTDRAVLLNQWIGSSRKEALRGHPWNFATKRTQLNTFPAGTLTPGATTGANIPFTSSAAVFTAGDVDYRLVADNGGVARITAFNSTSEVLATIESNFPDTAAILNEKWRIAPAFEWHFRYAKPTDYLRVVEVSETSVGTGVGFSWKWQWWSGTRGNQPEPVKVEGDFLVCDAGGRLNIRFIRDITDVSKWDLMAINAWEAHLAHRICYGVTGSLSMAKGQWDAYQLAISPARNADGQEGAGDEYPSDVLLAVRHN